MRPSPRHAARVAALVIASACGPVVGGNEGGSDGGSHGDDTGTTPSTSLSASGASADVTSTVTITDAEVDVDSGPDDSPIPDFWDTTPTCPRIFDATPIPSEVALLVDNSQTMTTQLVDHDLDTDTPDVTRWSMVANNLAETLPMLTVQSEVSAWRFPDLTATAPPSPEACDVSPMDHPYLGATADEILAYLPASDVVALDGATPIGRAYHFATLELASMLGGPPKHIVIVTDGAPNCGEGLVPPEMFDDVDTELLDDVDTLHFGGISTHVVAIDVPTGPSGGGPEGDAVADHHATLVALAEAGGTTLHDAADAASLDLEMHAILRDTQSCRLTVPAELAGLPFQIDIGDERVYYEIPPDLCADNWGYVFVEGTDQSVVEMCSGACDSLVTYGSAQIVEICVIAE